jgi:hypothetical protein
MFFAINGCPKFVHLAMSHAGKGGNIFFAINGCPKGQGHAPPETWETWGRAVASRFWRPNPTDTLKGGHQTAAVEFETCFRKCERLFGVHPLGCQLHFCKSHETAHVLGSYLVNGDFGQLRGEDERSR